jgi:hypothetical protein
MRAVRSLRAIVALIALGGAVGATAQDAPEFSPRVNWAYASYFGTGWYKVSDQRSAFIMRAAPRWQFGEAGFDDDGSRRIAYTVRVPLTLGLSRLDFEDVPGLIDPGNLATFSINSSVDADIPVTRRFSIRPSAEIGYGTVIGESDRALTWRAQLRGRYRFDSERVERALLGEVGLSGYDPNEGRSDDFGFVSIGMELGFPVDWFPSDGDQTMLYGHVIYTDFVNELDFGSDIGSLDAVASVWEAGLAIGRRENPIRIWRLNFDRLGLGFKSSPQSDLRGIKFIFRSFYEL